MGLPRESSFVRRVSPEHAEWGTTAELLASLIEVVDLGNRWFVQANSKKGAQPPKPVKILRPGERYKPKKKATPQQMKRFFGSRRR